MTTDQTKEGNPARNRLRLHYYNRTHQNRETSPYERLERAILIGGIDTGNYALNTLFKISIDILGSPIKGDQWRATQILESWERLLDNYHGTPFEEAIYNTSQILLIWGTTYGRESLCVMHLGTQQQQNAYLESRAGRREDRREHDQRKPNRLTLVATESCFQKNAYPSASN